MENTDRVGAWRRRRQGWVAHFIWPPCSKIYVRSSNPFYQKREKTTRYFISFYGLVEECWCTGSASNGRRGVARVPSSVVNTAGVSPIAPGKRDFATRNTKKITISFKHRADARLLGSWLVMRPGTRERGGSSELASFRRVLRSDTCGNERFELRPFPNVLTPRGW